MSLIDFSGLCMFIVFAQLTESRVLILRDYDDEPLVLGHASVEVVKHKHQAISSNYKPKRTHSKRTVLQYGRHIYLLDNVADSQDLRSKITKFKPDSISYNYVDIDDIDRASDPAKNANIYSTKPLQFCSGDQCHEDLRKFSKRKNDEDTERKHKIMALGRIKRFHIIDNKHKSEKPQSDSDEHHEKKKLSTSKKNKKKKTKHSSESKESNSKESGSAEKSWGSHKKTKKKFKTSKSSEKSVEIKRKPNKNHNDDDFASASIEKWKKLNKDLKSEDFRTQKNKKKRNNYGASDETKRTFAVEDDFSKQLNNIFHAKEWKTMKNHYDFDKRRRLEHFLPKRYHWDASEIQDLGYYWFNGPKGEFAAPKRLSK